MMGAKICYQINLQRYFGGGEVYTRFFSKAMLSLGWKVILFTNKRASFWGDLDMNGVALIPVDNANEIIPRLPSRDGLVITHAPIAGKLAESLKRHTYCCFAHMPLYERHSEPFRSCDVIFAVSRYVLDTLVSKGLDNFYSDPLYGVADVDRSLIKSGVAIRVTSKYDWDKRKVRDRLLSYLYPLYLKIKPIQVLEKKPGLTLGIVSRITTIKQFPLLFSYLVPIIQQYPSVNVEIIGNGGYASIRDLKKTLRPISDRVRYWGHQWDVKKIYAMLDFVMSGLPEKEALGLNIIESQMCNTPVLAIRAAPFIETVIDGRSGYLYVDPRVDNGREFADVLRCITSEQEHIQPTDHPAHLKKFTFDAYTQRIKKAIDSIHKNHP